MLQRTKQVRGSGHGPSQLPPPVSDGLSLAEMMDAAIEGTWRSTVLSFETCRALWRLLPVSETGISHVVTAYAAGPPWITGRIHINTGRWEGHGLHLFSIPFRVALT